MLELKNIAKKYSAGDTTVDALRGISVRFRNSEFVSILGPSGCGKTTLLNIIGGLDRYTSGDLLIGGRSTKDFSSRDWDTYRNHTIGFVFQSYNLIGHQNVLSNVELALTLSGISRSERRKRAIEALEKVGLKDQIHKKPNQMSGGQMQRVAIARALVNNPDILLADEPTGALDSATSIQIMELLKEVAKDRLVIMVTHNPELAEKYSTRTIRLLDGTVQDDSNPYDEASDAAPAPVRQKKSSMSFLTALSLSFNNLLTKKGRTIMVAFAGSIGIIGIALILSLSNGATEYIYRVEEDTLSSYPISIESASMDTSSMLTSIMEMQNKDSDNLGHDLDAIYSNNLMNRMMELISTEIQTNDLEAFKKYLESDECDISDYAGEIRYEYSTQMNIYASDTSDGVKQVQPAHVFSFMKELRGNSSEESSENTTSSTYMSSMMSSYNVWNQLTSNQDLLESQYEVLAGHLPENYDEVVIIADKNNEITDYALYALGLMDSDDLTAMMRRIILQQLVGASTEATRYSYEDLLSLTFRLVLNTDYYEEENGMWFDRSDDEDYMKQIVDNGLELKVVGIVRPSDDTITTSDTGGVGYTRELMDYLIEQINDSEIVKAQKANPDINVFTGLSFSSGSDGFSLDSLTDSQKEQLEALSQEEQAEIIAHYTEEASDTYDSNLTKLGVSDPDVPSAISIYPKDFESKDAIVASIAAYNQAAEDAGNDNLVIRYSDIVGAMMSSVTTIINAVTYILIAFVAISLIVSSIMIGIITYISVLERTKEIGILRAMGASKRDISRVFNAETLIIGFGAGLMGVGITFLLTIPINAVVSSSFDINHIASLPIAAAGILVLISMGLTLIAGLIPSKKAARKDPVTALRTE